MAKRATNKVTQTKSPSSRSPAGAGESQCFIYLRYKIAAKTLGPNREYLHRFANMHSEEKELLSKLTTFHEITTKSRLPMLVAPASRLFSTNSFTAVPRLSTTCPEQMRWTALRSMGPMALAGCRLEREEGQGKTRPPEAGGKGSPRPARPFLSGDGTRGPGG